MSPGWQSSASNDSHQYTLYEGLYYGLGLFDQHTGQWRMAWADNGNIGINKGRSEQDFGLIAEEVARIDPRFVTYKDGRIEGVKYPQSTAVLIGAVKELQAQNEVQAAELSRLKSEEATEIREIKLRLQELRQANRQKMARN